MKEKDEDKEGLTNFQCCAKKGWVKLALYMSVTSHARSSAEFRPGR